MGYMSKRLMATTIVVDHFTYSRVSTLADATNTTIRKAAERCINEWMDDQGDVIVRRSVEYHLSKRHAPTKVAVFAG